MSKLLRIILLYDLLSILDNVNCPWYWQIICYPEPFQFMKGIHADSDLQHR